MTLAHAVKAFDQWSYPWKFESSVRARLLEYPQELKVFDNIMTEVGKPDHWLRGDLVLGCKIAHAAAKARFPEIDDAVIESAVRAVSYSWR